MRSIHFPSGGRGVQGSFQMPQKGASGITSHAYHSNARFVYRCLGVKNMVQNNYFKTN